MTTPSSAPDLDPITCKDREHLRLLAAFHFVGAGLSLLGTGFLALHYSIFALVFSNPEMWEESKNPPPQEFIELFSTVFVWFYLVAAVFMVAFLVLNLLGGFFLLKRRHRTFCMVVAGCNCLHIPLGTILGVFTIVVLNRESVRALFEPTEPSL